MGKIRGKHLSCGMTVGLNLNSRADTPTRNFKAVQMNLNLFTNMKRFIDSSIMLPAWCLFRYH
jgi:hypothetical protein